MIFYEIISCFSQTLQFMSFENTPQISLNQLDQNSSESSERDNQRTKIIQVVATLLREYREANFRLKPKFAAEYEETIRDIRFLPKKIYQVTFLGGVEEAVIYCESQRKAE